MPISRALGITSTYFSLMGVDSVKLSKPGRPFHLILTPCNDVADEPTRWFAGVEVQLAYIILCPRGFSKTEAEGIMICQAMDNEIPLDIV